MSEEKEIKRFCDNPKCPNHNLAFRDDMHYHDVDSSGIAIGSICGILKTHPYKVKKVIPIVQSCCFMFRTTSHTVVEKTFHFCDICHGAIQFKELNYDQFNK